MQQTKPQFGIDAPGVVRNLGLIGIVLLMAFAIASASGRVDIGSMTLYPGCSFVAGSLLMLLTSTVGKPFVIRRMIRQLHLRGDEQVLDVGCGRGLLLIEAARQLPHGRATGLDLWSTKDQSGNAADATHRNAALAGVTDRVQIDTGDMRAMPYPDHSFDVIISSLAIHNLPNSADRDQAIREIVRVLKPDGHLALLDFRCTGAYAYSLREAGALKVRRSWPILAMFPPVWIVWAQGKRA
ncbi:class I SAM-dependent methyltransferase [Rhodanobacter sp. L36]|uniref:class I SAM-dependent methyltransferase n=1 Tax=Rhodanobacter sp. L36 TaxID=1747221 RepID=UPI00131AE98A|nr:class I SAM-dependent methyltransferase [Rhodanobacter sp. L36]